MSTKPDSFEIEVLPDGTLKFTTDSVSAANHGNADNFIKEMMKLAGGPVEIKHRHGKIKHHHNAESIQTLEAGHGHSH